LYRVQMILQIEALGKVTAVGGIFQMYPALNNGA